MVVLEKVDKKASTTEKLAQVGKPNIFEHFAHFSVSGKRHYERKVYYQTSSLL